jgi:predicted DNA-binding protein (UPF0251 family)
MYLSMNQAAARLGITRQWLWTLIKNGKITTVCLVGRDVVLVDDLFRLNEKNRKHKIKQQHSNF